jgi:RimJ/RimL family protein N-acetyltransferase
MSERRRFWTIGIRQRSEERPIGYCGLIIGRGTFDEPEIAYEILPDFRGHGYATEAAGAVIEAAFATGRRRLWATVGSGNEPSLRVLVKHGFDIHHRSINERGDVVWLTRNA